MHHEPIFSIFGMDVYLYGICIAIGLIGCFGFLVFAMWKQKFNEASSDAVIFIGIFATAFGFLIAAVFQATYNYIDDPSKGFDLGGGITFIGGLIGGVAGFLGVWNLYVYVIRPKTKIKWLKAEMNAGLCDALPFIPIGITIAHALGRFGCFWAGCCYGKQTDAWYGLPCAAGKAGNYIPLQLFEMAFLIVLTLVMALLYFKFKLNYNFAVYSISYGIWRFAIEYLRADDRGGFIPGLSPSQFWSILMVIVGVGYVFMQIYVFSKLMKHPELQQRKAETDAADGAAAEIGETEISADINVGADGNSQTGTDGEE